MLLDERQESHMVHEVLLGSTMQ